MNKKSWKKIITENEFWEIIQESLKGEANFSIPKQYQLLKSIFNSKTTEELVGFYYYASELYRKAYTSELWAAVYIARGRYGDDSFHYFRCWLVTRGKEIYYTALNNPDSLISEFKNYKYRDDILTDNITVTINEYFRERHPEKLELSTVIEEEYKEEFDTLGEMEMSALIKFNWEEGDKESLKEICPNLFKRYWGNPLK